MTDRPVRRALGLLGATAAYNLVEAGVAVWAGVAAGSIALIGFGLDSLIELTAASMVLWRFHVQWRGGKADVVQRAEDRVRRFVGITFFVLAGYVLFEAGSRLWTRDAPETSPLGIALATASLIIMPGLAVAKLRVARRLDSRALVAEAKETLACAYLSLTLLIGLAANAALGWWWADPAAALLMVPWLVREGREALGDEHDHEAEHEHEHEHEDPEHEPDHAHG